MRDFQYFLHFFLLILDKAMEYVNWRIQMEIFRFSEICFAIKAWITLDINEQNFNIMSSKKKWKECSDFQLDFPVIDQLIDDDNCPLNWSIGIRYSWKNVAEYYWFLLIFRKPWRIIIVITEEPNACKNDNFSHGDCILCCSAFIIVLVLHLS